MSRAVTLLLLPLALVASSDAGRKSVFSYRMRGEVRVLLFWLGKDQVGGGTIWVAEGSAPGGNEGWQEVEVLFGSKPERVPSKINRWGYGRERAEWGTMAGYGGPKVLRSVFEGLMRHSGEQSLGQVLENSRAAKPGQTYVYDAIRSEVRPEEALTEIRVFAEAEEFDYRHPEKLLSKYRATVAPARPDRQNRLANKPAFYAAPYGFLTGLSYLIRQMTEAFEKGQKNWRTVATSLNYAYNAKPYRLDIRKVEYLKTFQAPPGVRRRASRRSG